jgi:OOP family OmpA-OmpF porin
LEDLRRLVVGPERTRIDRLEQRPDTVAGMLPEAVSQSTERRGEELAIALEPTLTSTLRTIARRDTELFAELLAPTIGATVRKAVRDLIAVMLQRFNEALERSLSIKSVKWRLEALRTGRPFAEVVLLRTLVYQVDEVFLIHPTTGLVLLHVVRENGGVQQPDQVASMLEAIDSFVREAFRPQPSGVHLTHVEIGDLTLWLDRDASLAIAAVVRGIAPREYGDLLREVRERIYLNYQGELARFQSDVSPFATALPLLERCLHSARRPPAARAHIWLALAAAVAIVGGAALIARGHTRAAREETLLRISVEALQTEPGIAVTSVERENGRVRIRGFRDPIAPAPQDVLAWRGLPAPELSFEPFYSLDPVLVERRARQSLAPPAGVKLTLSGETLHVSGSAPPSWIERARLLVPVLPGIKRYDDRGLQAADAGQALESAAVALESSQIQFAHGSPQPIAGAALIEARTRLKQLLAAATQLRRDVCVAVVGHADPTGSQEANRKLSETRAIRVARELGVSDTARTRVIGAGVRHDAESAAQARSVTFEVDVGSGCRAGP